MNILIKSLMVLAAVSLGVNSFCLSPAEPTSADVQALIRAKKMVVLIDVFFGGDATRQVAHEGDDVFFKEFKERYDEYRVYFPQGDAEVDQALHDACDIHMREKLLKIMHLKNALIKQFEQKEKGFVKNKMMSFGCATVGVGCSLLAMSNLLERVEISLSNILLCGLFSGVAVISAQEAQRFNTLENEIKTLTHLTKLCKLDVDQLDLVHNYLFPGEQKLSEQVQASFGLDA